MNTLRTVRNACDDTFGHYTKCMYPSCKDQGCGTFIARVLAKMVKGPTNKRLLVKQRRKQRNK